MNIQPITDNNTIAMGKTPKNPETKGIFYRIKQGIVNAVPETTFKDGEKRLKHWIKFDEQMSRPAENRLVMGGTAIFMQPVIDASNKKVDDDTRKISICRTIAKIIAGTSVGILVRGSAYKIVAEMTNMNGTGKHSKTLLPTKYIKDLSKDPKLLKNYRSALSTSIAILAMCVTNFILDAPLTVFLTNKLKDAANLKDIKEGKNEKLS